jgi:hypothetical protein
MRNKGNASGALVGTASLESRLDDPRLRIFEVDEDVTAHEKGHIPWRDRVELECRSQGGGRSGFHRPGRADRSVPSRCTTTPPWCSTAATTTGSRRTRTG